MDDRLSCPYTVWDGWALAYQDAAAGIAQMQQGIAARQSMGAEVSQSFSLAVLAETSISATGTNVDRVQAVNRPPTGRLRNLCMRAPCRM